MIRFLIAILFAIGSLVGADLQKIIDSSPAGSVIELPEGIFYGPITIKKPLILRGGGKKSVIDGNFTSKVITVLSSDVTIENLAIRNSGRRRHSLDSAIFISGTKRVKVERCRIEDTLFGIIVSRSDNTVVRENSISSYDEPVADNRGDAIRLWLSNGTIIEKNRISGSRDIALMRSDHNIIEANIIEGSRYGVYLQMCEDIRISKNRIFSNYVGVLSSGSKDVKIERNTIVKTHLETGVGVVIRGGGVHEIRQNTLMRHAQAFYIDSSPAERGMKRFIERNLISLNNEAFHFHAIIKNNTIRFNNISDNLTEVVKNIRHTKSYDNDIRFNYWDRYEGFDKNGDGIGDTPYLILLYVDRLWHYDHHLKFFRFTPLFSIVEFIERLAPFSEPILLMRDNAPQLYPVEDAGAGASDVL